MNANNDIILLRREVIYITMDDNPYSLDEQEIKELLTEYAQCEGADQESNMIWYALDEAQEKALELNSLVHSIMIMCAEAENMDKPLDQLQSMLSFDDETESEDEGMLMLEELQEMVEYCLADINTLIKTKDSDKEWKH